MFLNAAARPGHNLRARLITGSVLVLLTFAVLVLDGQWAPYYPFLALTTTGFGLLASLELRRLLPEPRPLAWWMHTSVIATLLANWSIIITGSLPGQLSPQTVVLLVAVGAISIGFFAEMARFSGPCGATHRLAYGALAVLWLGLAPSFLVQLRWLERHSYPASHTSSDLGLWALAFAIFVPKTGDIAAYFVGSRFGQHRLAPILSPQKSWEGAIAGFLGSVAAGLIIVWQCKLWTDQLLLPWHATLASSAVIGVVAQLSDLAESLVKREHQVKDTSAYVPGLGGVLDVVDSLLLSAPISWLALQLWHGE